MKASDDRPQRRIRLGRWAVGIGVLWLVSEIVAAIVLGGGFILWWLR